MARSDAKEGKKSEQKDVEEKKRRGAVQEIEMVVIELQKILLLLEGDETSEREGEGEGERGMQLFFLVFSSLFYFLPALLLQAHLLLLLQFHLKLPRKIRKCLKKKKRSSCLA